MKEASLRNLCRPTNLVYAGPRKSLLDHEADRSFDQPCSSLRSVARAFRVCFHTNRLVCYTQVTPSASPKTGVKAST